MSTISFYNLLSLVLVTQFSLGVRSFGLQTSIFLPKRNSNLVRGAPFLSTSTSLHDGAPPRKGGRSRRREKLREDVSTTTDTLEWETFDFSSSPKWDSRFEDGAAQLLLHTEFDVDQWQKVQDSETLQDVELQQRFDRQHTAWADLPDALVEQATDLLVPFVNPDRWQRIQAILQQRTQNVRFLFEDPCNPSNVWACLRTLDSFGIQNVDVVIQSGSYKGKAAITQKRGMRTAMGSAKWLTVRNHLSTTLALQSIKDQGYHIVCTDGSGNANSKDIRTVDWDASGKKVLIVMGNEERGISEEVKELADEYVYLPMVGFAESFNLSVATAMTCAHLSAASGNGNYKKGPLRPGDLDEREFKTLLLKGALNSIRHRTSQAMLKQHGLRFPPDVLPF
jgi:tRNA (guanosine-2'-O-)-methyltransferase